MVGVWLKIWMEPPRTYWLEAILLLFVLGGLIHFGVMRSGLYRIWQTDQRLHNRQAPIQMWTGRDAT